MAIGQMVLFASDFGLDQHLVTLLARRAGRPASVLIEVTVLKAVLFLLAWFAMFGFISWQGYDPALKRLAVIMGVGMGAEALGNSFFSACRVWGRQDIEGKLRSLAAVVGFGFGLSALFFLADPMLAAYYKILETAVNLAGVSLAAASEYRRQHWNRTPPQFGLRQFRIIWSTWRGGITYTLIGISGVLYNKINIFFLQRAAGAAGVAQYSATWQLIEAISVLISVLLLKNVMFPLFVKLRETDNNEFLRVARVSARWLIGLAVGIMYVLFVESDRIITTVYGPGYTEAIWLQKYLVPAVIFTFLHNLAAYLMISARRQRLLLLFCLIGLALSAVFCVTIIPHFPLVGAVLTIVLTKGLVTLMTVSYCQAHFRFIPVGCLRNIAVAGLAGAGLYFMARGHVPRGIAEIAALCPLLVVRYWRWRRLSGAHGNGAAN